jgi:hypothetical protein
MNTLVHVTHEAVQKIGGIGTVLEGLLTSKTYNDHVDRSILIAPLFTTDGPPADRLGPDGQVHYSSLDNLRTHPLASALDHVAREWNVEIVYGHRRFHAPPDGVPANPEVLLIEIRNIHRAHLNQLKARLWEVFKLESDDYEDYWEFEEYMRLAGPAIAALYALDACKHETTYILAHEFMGVPTALAAKLDPWTGFKSIFYAHEAAPIRKIVEDHPGHDTMFYNVLEAAHQTDNYIDDVFGDQAHYFKFALVSAARFLDTTLAVGHYVVKELRFLSPEFDKADIHLCYNGIPAHKISLHEKHQAKARLRQYAENLLGYKPDDVFSHVTRTTLSKGLWRDLRVLESLDKAYAADNRTAVTFILSCEVPSRPPKDILHMEKWWNWPVAHREGSPDLSGGEALYYQGVQEFNAKARNIKVIYVNQFGWTRAVCGNRMPEDMTFADIRVGTDLEFGQSIYEPFGIAQLEPLSFGAVCVPTEVCGCVGFLTEITSGQPSLNFVIADYTDLATIDIDPADHDPQTIAIPERDRIERIEARRLAGEILKRLPRSDEQTDALIHSGYALASQMTWDRVVKNYLLPGLAAAQAQTPQPA